MSYRYRVLCTIHGYQDVWSDDLVTTCPINAADPINQDATCIDAMLRPVIQLTPVKPTSFLSKPTRIGSVVFNTNMGTLKRIGVLSHGGVGITSYKVEAYNKTDLTSLGNCIFTNTGDPVINYIENIGDISSNNVTLEFYISVTSVTKKNVYVDQIILYCY